MVRTDLPTSQTAGPEHPGPVTEGYGTVGKLLAAGSWVLLDGPVETGPRAVRAARPAENPAALVAGHALAPMADRDELVAAHCGHVASGCDVIRTSTAALWPTGDSGRPDGVPAGWTDLARERIEAARAAASGTRAAVAYTIGRQADGPGSEELARALDRLFGKAAPDLVLVESLSVIRPSLFVAVSQLRSLGLPLWLSFRRCRDGLCGPSGHHWSGDEPDRLGSAARRLEQMGVAALLVNCIPPDHVAGTIGYLRYFTDLPLGVYANIERGFEPAALSDGAPPVSYDDLALQWRAEGAQIVGGCCGVGSEHLRAARRKLNDTVPAHAIPAAAARANAIPAQAASDEADRDGAGRDKAKPAARPWQTARGRPLFPLPFPALACEAGVAPPAVGDLLLWEYLYRERIGDARRCLDVGSGSGLLAVQLALNGATHVHSIDSSQAAVDSTRRSAFRNDVSSAVTAETADIIAWPPREHYEVVVASLEQPATDPSQQDPGMRDFDPWGRLLIDAFLAKLPVLLARDGVAYMIQSSLISQQQTTEMLAAAGLAGQVVDWRLWLGSTPQDAVSHRGLIERRSDAFHIDVPAQEGRGELIVVYLLEIRRAGALRMPVAAPPPRRPPGA
jgi:S-methylmethionine-dependent homocysteine/selenocysteine methylase/SAM-dependent methyltransferase